MARAKFTVNGVHAQIVPSSDGKKMEVRTVTLLPSTDGSQENQTFFAATPSGQIALGTIRVEAAHDMELGTDVWVDITPITAAK